MPSTRAIVAGLRPASGVPPHRISPAYRTIPVLLLLVLVVYIRPQGLLGRR